MNKEEKKKILQALREEEKRRFNDSLPMSREQFKELFDYLDSSLEENSCLEDHRYTIEYLETNSIDEDPVLSWLRENGGSCDCEVLANVEELFE